MLQLWLGRESMPIRSRKNFGLMGILNLTPDSFYDGGRYNDLALAVEQAGKLLAQGADIIDLGAESSRPGASLTGLGEELERLLPAVALCRREFPGACVSIDCWRAETAQKVLELGADVINDISGCRWDAGLVDVLAAFKPGYVLMHGGSAPGQTGNACAGPGIIDKMLSFFSERLNFLARAGLPENRVALDPGIGFAKTLDQNLEIMRSLPRFLEFGRPLLLGLSMKSLFGTLLDLETADRELPTAIATALAWQAGVFWHRVHHPASAAIAIGTAGAMTPERRRQKNY